MVQNLTEQFLLSGRISSSAAPKKLGRGCEHARFYFYTHDILVLSATEVFVCNEKPISVDNIWVVCYLNTNSSYSACSLRFLSLLFQWLIQNDHTIYGGGFHEEQKRIISRNNLVNLCDGTLGLSQKS